MPFNGSGLFTRLYNWVTDAAANIPIESTRMDAEMDGFASGLSNCLTKDGQQTVTANIPMSGFKITGLGNGTAPTDAATVGQMQTDVTSFVAAGGTADAITATFSPAITVLTNGLLLRVRALGANATTTPTFSPNGLTAHTITKNGGQALVAGDIFGAGHEIVLQYNTSATRWELLNPGYNITAFAKTFLDDANASAVATTLSVVQTARNVSTGAGLTGGGNLSADRTLSLDVNGLTTDSSPDATADFVPTYDTSSAGPKKVLLQNVTPDASTSVKGKMVQADQATMETGTSTAAAVTPGVQQFHPLSAKAWCVFDGTATGSNAPTEGKNVTTVTRNSAGDYTVNFAVDFPSGKYGYSLCAEGTAASGRVCFKKNGGTTTDTQFTFLVLQHGTNTPTDGNTQVTAIFYGDLA